jgi:ABC-2 type transport system permease protein
MRNIWIIAKREYRLYFASPVAYVVAFFIYGVSGIFFYLNLQFASQQQGQGYVPGIDSILAPMATILIFIIPAITTRLLAEEQRMGTIELLLTAPVRDWELVVGKWLGALLLMLTILVVTLIYPLVLNQLVDPGIDKGPIITGYIGLVLVAGALISAGLVISSLFTNQVAAFLATFALLVFLWWILGPIAQVIGPTSGNAQFLSYLDFNDHYLSNMVRGVFDLSDIIYFLSVTALGLFLSTMSVELRRWR